MKINKNTSLMIDEAFRVIGHKLPIFCISEEFANIAHSHFEKLSSLITPESVLDSLGVYIVMGNLIIFDHDKESDKVEIEVFDIKTGIRRTNQNMGEFMPKMTAFILSISLFKKYGEVETKLLPPKSKQGNTIKCKYINQTNHNITYLNSTWFTNLVKSDAFKVSGHFRLQPCHDDNGLPTKKLIWISDFVKSGYTAPARKLKHAI